MHDLKPFRLRLGRVRLKARSHPLNQPVSLPDQTRKAFPLASPIPSGIVLQFREPEMTHATWWDPYPNQGWGPRH